MGCGSSNTNIHSAFSRDSGPAHVHVVEDDGVDVASVKDFHHEHAIARSLHASPIPSSQCSSAYSSDHSRGEDAGEGGIEGPPPDNLSIQGELPPLRPPRRTKEQFIPHLSVFESTDQHVKNISSSATDSVTSLAYYLTSSSPSNLHSVRAIFVWLALNIAYDSKSYVDGAGGPQDPGFILESRKALCVGFAHFCELLCNLANIPCLSVRGIAKGYSYDPSVVFSPEKGVNHAWNLVLVDREWRPLDCAWGAGYVRDDGTFCREFDDHWFLTDPEDFLSTHFPYMYRDLASSKAYQLIHSPVDLPTFSSMVKLDSLAQRVGLKPLSHPNGVISDVCHDVTVTFKVTKQLLGLVTAYLTDRSDVTSRKVRSGLLTSWDDDNTCRIYVRLRRPGKYLLTILGQANAEHRRETLHRLCLYSIECVDSHPNPHPFPEVPSTWGLQYPAATECWVKKVKDAKFSFKVKDGEVTVPLVLCRHTEIAVKLRHAENMAENMVNYTLVEYSKQGEGETGVEISARLPRVGYYLLRVFATHPTVKGLQHVADYLLFSDTYNDCLPFPVSTDFAHVHCARLIEPLVRHVPRKVTSLFRVRADTLSRMRVNGRKMEQGPDGVWQAEVTFDDVEGNQIVISGAVEREAITLTGLYTFKIVEKS